MLTDFTIEDYLSNRRYINLSLVNKEKCGYINSLILPYINQFLTQSKLSYYRYYVDSSTLDIGSGNIGFICSRNQFTFEEEEFGDVTDVISYTTDECIDILNTFLVRFPFSKSEVNNLLLYKKRENKIIPMGYDVDYQYKYIHVIKTIVYFEDNIQLEKDMQLQKLHNVLWNIIQSSDYSSTDLTNYDLSTRIFYDESNMLIFYQDNTNFRFLNKESVIEFMNDFTNLIRSESIDSSYDYTFMNHDESTLEEYLDSSIIYKQYNINIIDNTTSLFSQNIQGDNTSAINGIIIPISIHQFMGLDIINFFKTVDIGNNEFSGVGNFVYGDYLYKALKYYYGFDSTLINILMKLRIAQIKKRSTESMTVNIVGDIIEQLTGVSISESLIYSEIIKTIESDMSDYLDVNSFGFSVPVIYKDGIHDITTNIIMDQTQTVDDLYSVLNNIDLVKYLYIFDFGYDHNLQFNPMTLFHDRGILPSTGYISCFTAENKIL